MSRLAVLRLVTLLLCVAASGWPIAAADRRVEITPDGDYFGFDLRTVQSVSQKQCEAACIGDKACKAFTYNMKAQ